MSNQLWTQTEFSLTCDRSGTDHIATVALPARYGQIERPPVIVCLDGPWVFGTVCDATRIMSMSGEAPEAIVVGLSFAADSVSEYLRQRARWFTPTPYVPPAATGVKGITADETGRADVLRAMIADQLLPRLAQDYSTGDRWLVGHSFSALFGLRSMFAAPSLFDRWLLASPSIWWDDRAILGFEADYAERHDDLATTVFLSSGSDEDTSESVKVFRMGPNVADLAETLRSRRYPGLNLTHQVMPGDAHASTIGAAVSKGLRSLTAPPDQPA